MARQEKNYLGRVSDKKFGGSSLFPPSPPFTTALCPFLGWICYYSMPTVVEFGGADLTLLCGQTREELHILDRLNLGCVSGKKFGGSSLSPPSTYYHHNALRSPTSHFIPFSFLRIKFLTYCD